MEVILDRFEGKQMIRIEKDKLPSGVKEGTVLTLEADKVSINYVKKKPIKKPSFPIQNPLLHIL